jgi:hypothetical protein
MKEAIKWNPIGMTAKYVISQLGICHVLLDNLPCPVAIRRALRSEWTPSNIRYIFIRRDGWTLAASETSYQRAWCHQKHKDWLAIIDIDVNNVLPPWRDPPPWANVDWSLFFQQVREEYERMEQGEIGSFTPYEEWTPEKDGK